MAFNHLSDLLKEKRIKPQSQSQHSHQLIIPKVNHITSGDRTFAKSTLAIWNDLSKNICNNNLQNILYTHFWSDIAN